MRLWGHRSSLSLSLPLSLSLTHTHSHTHTHTHSQKHTHTLLSRTHNEYKYSLSLSLSFLCIIITRKLCFVSQKFIGKNEFGRIKVFTSFLFKSNWFCYFHCVVIPSSLSLSLSLSLFVTKVWNCGIEKLAELWIT
jgi:hypothetical protein